jgi:hypothetical protein
MTDYNDSSKRYENNRLNLQDLESAINKGQEERLKQLLTNELFDELQKSAFIKLAKSKGNANIIKLLEDTPATP